MDGLLRSMLGARHSQAGERAMASLRGKHPSSTSKRIPSANIRTATKSARTSSSTTAAHRRARAGVLRHRPALMHGAWAAATIAALITVMVFVANPAHDTDQAQVVSVGGTVISSRKGRLEPVRDGMVIGRGELLTVGVNSSLRLLWHDGTMLVLAAETRVQLEHEGAGKRLRLLSGRWMRMSLRNRWRRRCASPVMTRRSPCLVLGCRSICV